MILRQANCASTWANQISGSAGQKGRSLRLTTAEMSPGVGVATAGDVEDEECEPEVAGTANSPGLSSLDIATNVGRVPGSPMESPM